MVIEYLFRVVHAAVTDLDGVSVEDFSQLVIFGKVLVTRARNLFILRSWSWKRRKLLTSSHVSVPSQLPIVTSNVVLPFFCQDICLWIKMQFFVWIIMFLSSVVMLSQLEVKSSALFRSALFRRSWLMDGQNSLMSKQMKLNCCFSFRIQLRRIRW